MAVAKSNAVILSAAKDLVGATKLSAKSGIFTSAPLTANKILRCAQDDSLGPANP